MTEQTREILNSLSSLYPLQDYEEQAIDEVLDAAKQPERIKARWLPVGMADAVGGESAMWGDEMAYHACDNCWQQALEKDGEEVLSNFCPFCGAEMEVTT